MNWNTNSKDLIEKYCINCGNSVKNLYKEYSSTVLKLTKCPKCRNVADKYVEYDLVIVIIDLILLKIMAYRHILLNSEFKNFWKLSVAIIFLESYSNWNFTREQILDASERHINSTSFYQEDLKFYQMSLDNALGFSSFIIVAYILTYIYCYLKKTNIISFVTICKLVTLSSCGTFLLLPSLIWETHIQEFHVLFVSLYTMLSHLLAHKAVTNAKKGWTWLVIFSSYLIKIYVTNSSFINFLINV